MDHRRSKGSRHCTAPVESCAHVLNGCDHASSIITRRHDKVQARLVWSVTKGPSARFEQLTENRFYDDAGNLNKSDPILRSKASGDVFIADVAVYYETGPERAEEVMRSKERKYAPIIPVVKRHLNIPTHKPTLASPPEAPASGETHGAQYGANGRRTIDGSLPHIHGKTLEDA
ncbi:hypothetical protein ACOME3_008813 [Neoechinorhynchus agilis]